MVQMRALVVVFALVLLGACSQPSSDELIGKAHAAINAGEFRTAEIHLKNLLQQDGNNSAARALLGELYLRNGDNAGAEQLLRKAIELGADKARLQLPLARALMGERKFEDLVKQIDQGPPLEGEEQISVLILKGAAQLALGSPARAEDAYREAIRINPSSAPARTELAALQLSTNRVAEGSASIDAVLKDEPGFVPALLLRGRLQATLGHQDAAAETLEGVLNALRTSKQQATREYSAALSDLTDVRLQQHRVDDAAKTASELLALDPQNPVARYAKARVEFEQGALAESESRLESLIAQLPEYGPAYGLLGVIKVKQNQEGQARQYLNSAITKNPNDNASRLALAELDIQSGDIEAAKKLFGDANGTSSGVSLALAGRMSQLAGRTDVATTFFNESERTPPSDLQQLVNQSQVYLAAGEFERAVRTVQTSNVGGPQAPQLRDFLLALVQIRAGDLKAADTAAQRLTEALPKVSWPENLRGTIALRGSDLAGARAAYARAAQIDPRDATPLVNLARIAFAENQKPEAEQYLQRALVVAPENPAVLGGLAQLAADRRDSAKALSYVRRLPDTAARYAAEGAVQAGDGHFDAAADAYSKAYQTTPGADLAIRAFNAASRAGRPQATALLEDWLAGHPQDIRVRMALGTVALAKNDRAAAVSHYETVLSIDPKQAEALNNLAWLYGEQGDARAVDLGRRAYEADPKNPSIADTYGWLQVRHGEPQAGLALLTQAAAALPENPDVQYHWAVALGDSGERAKAIEALRNLVRPGRNFASRTAAEQSLNDLEKAAATP